jgi:squalene-associated FAD-dependent desaturase
VSDAPQIAVVGGGLAGVAAALACADAGARVRLFEARACLGGATWSTEKRGLRVDNGQHVFMRCCTAYRGLLARLGVDGLVSLQPRLEVPVAAPGRPLAWIRRHPLPAPAHLAPSLLGFPHLPLAARLRAAQVARAFAALDPDDAQLDDTSLGSWLADRGVRDAASLAFWDLLIRPTLNVPAADASLALAARVLRTGFLDRADAADIGIAAVPFSELHDAAARRALQAAGAAVALRAAVCGVQVARSEPKASEGHQGGVLLQVGGESVRADAAILAAPPDTAARLAPPEAGLDAAALAQLGASPIVNLHVWFDRRVTDLPFVAGWATPLQWIFDRTRASGAERGQVLTVSLSAAEEWIGKSRAELRAVFLPALRALFPAAREAQVLDFFALCEPAATFRQVAGTRVLRPAAVTQHRSVYVAGAWTDTGWPATMESAVRSGTAAAEAALRALARAPHAEAA